MATIVECKVRHPDGSTWVAEASAAPENNWAALQDVAKVLKKAGKTGASRVLGNLKQQPAAMQQAGFMQYLWRQSRQGQLDPQFRAVMSERQLADMPAPVAAIPPDERQTKRYRADLEVERRHREGVEAVHNSVALYAFFAVSFVCVARDCPRGTRQACFSFA